MYFGWIGLFVLFVNVTHAHEIHLKNGNIIQTKSVEEKNGTVIYQERGGTIAISKELVQEIIYTHPSQKAVSLNKDSGLTAYYPFNDNANDESALQNNGTVHGARLAADRFGKLNRAFHFNGVDNYIQIGSPVLPEPPFSISLWFNAYVSKPDDQYIMNNGRHPGASHGWYCLLTGGNTVTDPSRSSWPKRGIQCGVSTSENHCLTIVTKESMTLGQWYHVVWVWDGSADVSHMSLYIDGKLAPVLGDSRVCDGHNGLNNMRIGASSDISPTGFFNGQIDDIRIYNRVLSAGEIQQLNDSN